MDVIASYFILLTLLAVSMLHVAWAWGSRLPASDAKTLARMVVGVRDAEKMPRRAASAFVEFATFLGALWPFFMSGQVMPGLPSWLVTPGSLV